MSKKERNHGDQMATMGELHGLYKIKIVINERITKLETIKELDDKKGKRVKMLSEEEQLKKIDRATDKALHEIEKERKGKPRDYVAEWFKWVEKVGKYLRKHILH